MSDNERDELADELQQFALTHDREDGRTWADYADALLAAGYRKPRTITTPEELDALPVGSIILDVENDAWQKMTSGSWSCADQVNGSPSGYLAATVLHVGGNGS